MWLIIQEKRNTCNIFIAAPEQLGPHQGHLTQIGQTLCQNKKFTMKIAHVLIDKSHIVASAGMPGISREPPYQPAYGQLDSVVQVALFQKPELLTVLDE